MSETNKYPRRQDVISAVVGTFAALSSDTSATKGTLASIRRAGLVPLAEAPAAWETIYRNDRFSQYPEREQLILSESLFDALYIFAIHTRSNTNAYKSYDTGGLSVGKALSALQYKRGNVDKKVSAVLSSSTPEQTVRLLSPLLRMVPEVSIDYPKMVWDFYSLNSKYSRTVLMSWAKDYYTHTITQDKVNTTNKEL